MTILEKRKRRDSARKAIVTFSPAKSTLSYTEKGALEKAKSRPKWRNHLRDPEQEANKRPSINRFTEKMMREVVAEMISNCDQGSCSLLRVLNAISMHCKLMDAHANSQTENQGRRNVFNKFFSSVLGHKSTARRFQFKTAFDRIKRGNVQVSEEVFDWSQVREVLSREMDFESDESSLSAETALIEATPSNSIGISPIPCRLSKLEISTPSPSFEKFRQISAHKLPRQISEEKKEDAFTEQLELEMAQRKERERKEREDLEDTQRRMEEKAKEEEAQKMASSVLREFTQEEEEIVKNAMYGGGPGHQVLKQEGSASVTRASMSTLRPGQWLNDEVIVFFLLMLAKRDEELCRMDPSRKRSHFFNSFFITKLLNEGHTDLDGVYQYSNVKRWSKKVPGKDIFKLDKIIFPININRMHWVCAVAFMQEKRIQFYDSMGADGMHYLESIFRYIQDEHKDKKKAPLPDASEWQLVTCTEGTPRQANGFDCGVFTCCFADFIANDCPLVFTQKHVNKCRKRIALSIMRGQAII